MLDLAKVTQQALSQEETGWNMGSFGAIAEFHHVSGDPSPGDTTEGVQFTSRGGIHLDSLENVVPVAYETLSPKPHRWTQAVSLYLPQEMAAMHRRKVLTEPENPGH